MRNKQKGFTLIELLIVIVIIGILATMAVPIYQKLVEKAKWSEAKSMLGSIRRACLLYYNENGFYPNHPTVIVVLNGSTKGSEQFGGGGGGAGDYGAVVNSLMITVPPPKADGMFVYDLYQKDFPSSADPCCASAFHDKSLDGYQESGETYMRIYYDGRYETITY